MHFSFPIPVGILYSQKYFSEESRQSAINLLEDVRSAFIDILYSVPWMDDRTREIAVKKAESITAQVSYPNELIENNNVDEYYENIEMLHDNFLLNALRLAMFNTDNAFDSLRESVDKANWETLLDLDPSDVNAFYVPYENSIRMFNRTNQTFIQNFIYIFRYSNG